MALYLSACGFTPVYSTIGDNANAVSNELSDIKIALIPDQEGQMLRNSLIDRFYKNGYPTNPKYQLTVSKILETVKDLDVTITSDTTRAQLQLKSTFRLTNIKTEELVIDHKLRATTSYNVLGSEFATRVTERNARENAIEDLARQIERDISIYLKTKSEE